MTKYVLLLMKWIYCHVYQINNQGNGKLNNYNTNNPYCFFVPKGVGISKKAGK